MPSAKVRRRVQRGGCARRMNCCWLGSGRGRGRSGRGAGHCGWEAATRQARGGATHEAILECLAVADHIVNARARVDVPQVRHLVPHCEALLNIGVNLCEDISPRCTACGHDAAAEPRHATCLPDVDAFRLISQGQHWHPCPSTDLLHRLPLPGPILKGPQGRGIAAPPLNQAHVVDPEQAATEFLVLHPVRQVQVPAQHHALALRSELVHGIAQGFEKAQFGLQVCWLCR
mmetsp:Transcript_129594/g.415546  ORF Transcript_129594/g.415546 Transcript_129594/m.415546 type:complete len:231 (+) Transcript_129594:531-1223(+)